MRRWLSGNVPLWLSIVGVVMILTIWAVAYLPRIIDDF